MAGDLGAGRWQVPTLELEPDLALALLRGLDREAAAYGASVGHLIELAGFAADLVARGRLLPSVLSDPPHAVWRPVITGADAAWTRVLASSMPLPLTAASPGDGLAVWSDALDALVDATARATLNSMPLAIGRAGTPATRAWLAALVGNERRFTADRPALAALTAMVAAWQQDAVEGPVRACFRLWEPVDGGAEWQVRFGLQAADEPSLFVDADAVWRSREMKLPALARHVHAPQETFLAELGKASRLYPELDGALRTARPLSLSLDTEGAHRFLSGVSSRAGHGRIRRTASRVVEQAVDPARAEGHRLDTVPAGAGGSRYGSNRLRGDRLVSRRRAGPAAAAASDAGCRVGWAGPRRPAPRGVPAVRGQRVDRTTTASALIEALLKRGWMDHNRARLCITHLLVRLSHSLGQRSVVRGKQGVAGLITRPRA